MNRIATLLLAAALLAGCGGSSIGGGASDVKDRAAQPFRAHVHFAEAAGTKIAYYERGHGPPLAMLMGTASTMSEWDPALLRLLARNHRLLLFDYPGIGLSGPWHGRDFDSLADATAALMHATHLRRADVLGWSMGGFVAQRLVVSHPNLISHLILAGTNPGGDSAVLGTRRAQEIDSEPHPSEEEILGELYPPNRQGEARRFVRRIARAADSGETPDDFHVPAATARAQVAAEDPWLRSNLNYRQLAAVAVPTLVAGGTSDPVVPPPNERRIAARIPGAELRMFPGAHAFLFQDHRRFASAVERLTGH